MAAGLHGGYPPSCRSFQADSREKSEAVMDGTGALHPPCKRLDITQAERGQIAALARDHRTTPQSVEAWLIRLGIATLTDCVRDPAKRARELTEAGHGRLS